MKRISVFLLIVISVFLIACATSKQTYTSDGQQGYIINCSGSGGNWGMCYEKAGKICGDRGYAILEKSGDHGAMVTAGQFGLFGGSVMNRIMVIQCK